MSTETATLNELLDDDDIESEEWSEEGRRLVRVGGHMLRLRRLMLSHLLRDRMAGDEEEDEEEVEEAGDEDRQLFRLLVATGILRRRRLRRLLLAHLRGERKEDGGEDDEREGEKGSNEERHAAERPALHRKDAAQSERAEAAHAGGKPRREKRRRAIRR